MLLTSYSQPVVYQKKYLFIVFSFVLALLLMLGILNVSFGMLVHVFDPSQSLWWHQLTPVVLMVICGLLFVCMAIKHLQYANSGQIIARRLGAIEVDDNDQVPESQLLQQLNQQTAALYAVPPAHLYLFSDELGINALTVGYSPQDVSIILTWGAIQSLDQQELAGVLAFQYQKIIRGEYIAHTYLQVIFSGLLQISQLGSYFIVKGSKTNAQGRVNKASAIYVAIGSLIWLLGSLGVLISRLLKYFLLFGRESHTDHLACQRIQRQSLLNALARIYVHEYGSQLYRTDCEALTQYCFANALTDQSWFRIHGSLGKRINRLRPNFQYQVALKKTSKQFDIQQIIEKILLPTKEDVLLNYYQVHSWQNLPELPMLRLSPISFTFRDAVRPLSPSIRRKMEHSDVIKRARQTATGSRELIVAIFMIRQYREFVPEDAQVSHSMVKALLKLDGRVHIQVFYDALKQIKLMPRIASEQFVLRLMQIVQADGEIGLLDCLLIERIKFNQGLLEDNFPVARRDCGQAIVHLIDALLHVQQINSVLQMSVRQQILKQLLSSKELQQYRHITDEPLDLLHSIRLISGLLTRDKLYLLNVAEQCLWSERVITQDELDVLQLLYWRLGFESEEVINQVFKQSSLLII